MVFQIGNKGMSINRRGQLTLSFNWIFVMIAGTVILLFFVGLIMSQKTSSEQKLNFDVVNILDSILVGSTVSEQTINTIDTSGISDRELFFECQLDSGGGFVDIFARYGISGTSASTEVPIQVLMGPERLSSKELVLWSLPYEMPFKVMDLLIFTGSSHQYYVFGGERSTLRSELQNATTAMNIDFVRSASEVTAIGANEHVRIIDLDGGYISEGAPVPVELFPAKDTDVDAVVMGIAGYDIYQKDGSVFTRVTREGQTPIVSLFTSERDAAQISAMFADSSESYQCNMMKAFKRMEIVSELYLGKAEQLVSFYGKDSLNNDDECLLWLDAEGSSDDVLGTLSFLNAQLSSCVINGYTSCISIEPYARRLLELNNELDDAGCVTVY